MCHCLLKRSLGFVLALLLTGCSEEQVDPDVSSPSLEGLPVHPPNPLEICPDPNDCELAGTLTGAHVPAGIALYFNPDLDDAVTRWSADTSALVECATQSSLFDCVASAPLPDACLSAWTSAVSANDTPGQQLQAFEALFLGGRSPCGAPDQETGP